MRLITIFFTLVLLTSCSTDYDGKDPVADDPTLVINESASTFVNSFTRVEWFGIIGTETDMDYYYCVTTDTSITAQTALSALPEDKWITTKNNYADISFPMMPFNSDVVFYKDSVYQDPDSNQIAIKIAFSKIFVYAKNSVGTRSPLDGRLYSRINNKPSISFIKSKELAFLSEKESIIIYEDKLILPKSNPHSVPVDFAWWGTDPDNSAKIEFKWELWKKSSKTLTLVRFSEWSETYGVELNDDLYYNDPEADYIFKLYIRDDALEPGDNGFTVDFSVFAPTFDKGILLIDDTDPTLYPASTLINGNPDATATRAFYENLLEYSGYKPEGEAADSLSLYKIKKFEKGTEFVGWEYIYEDDDNDPSTPDIVDSIAAYRAVYKPELKELTKYRLVVIASDDRSNANGVDFAGFPPYTGYNEYLSKYLSSGGKIYMLGNSVIMGKYYTSPNQLPINRYLEPFRLLIDGVTETGQGFSANSEEFFRDYFGIYAMTFPEQKTYYTIPGTSSLQYCTDHYLSDNYDFIGIEKYDTISDLTVDVIRIDSVKVNDYWKNIPGTQGRIRQIALKDNGTVFTGVPTIEAFKGEVVYKYRSIYDLSHDDSIAADDFYYGVSHYLWNKNRVTGEIVSPVLKRSGTIATRYIADGDQYRTAFFGIPIFFMDNSQNQISDMFKAMIDWFDLEKDPLSKRR